MRGNTYKAASGRDQKPLTVEIARNPRSFPHHHLQEARENGRCGQAEDDQLSSEGKMAELIVQDLAEAMDIKAVPKEGEP
jgi:hypothetical protein